jgi:tetraprenyl-beta-curcumene synthase
VREAEIDAIEAAYFPWIGALHSLLDNLVDIAEDYATGQRSLVGCYASSLDASTRMRLLAERSLRAAEELPGSRGHVLILAAMASFYLSTPEASAPAARPVAHAVLDALGEPAQLSMLVFRTRLRARRLMPRAPGGPARRASGAEVVLPAIEAVAPAGVQGAVAPAPRGHEPYGVK